MRTYAQRLWFSPACAYLSKSVCFSWPISWSRDSEPSGKVNCGSGSLIKLKGYTATCVIFWMINDRLFVIVPERSRLDSHNKQAQTSLLLLYRGSQIHSGVLTNYIHNNYHLNTTLNISRNYNDAR